MNDFDSSNAIWLVVALVLAVSALAAHRMSLGSFLRGAISWAAIIAIAVLAVSHRHELHAFYVAATERLGIDEQQASGGMVRIRMAPDGHFWARVKLNGVEKRMLVDRGATTTAISADTAAAVNADVEDNAVPLAIETANGRVGAQPGSIAKVQVGPLETDDLGVVVSEHFGDLNVLGRNFLSRLKSWRVEDNVLVLEPRRGAQDDGEDASGAPAAEHVRERPTARREDRNQGRRALPVQS